MFVQVHDFILNGQGHGGVGEALQNVRFDPGLLRPFWELDEKSPRYRQRCVIVNTGRTRWNDKTKVHEPIRQKMTLNEALRVFGQLPPVVNATALRKEEWLELDRQVLRAARPRLRAWADLAAANSYGGFNGMSKMILEHETMSDPGEALVDMDGLSEGRNDAPKFQLEGLPLAITHSDFFVSSRRLAISRNTGTPLDTTMGEAAGRRVAETIEKTTIGNQTGIAYGGNSTQTGGYGRTSQVYGYLNHPARLTKTNMTAPTAGGWTPETTQKEINTALNQLRNNKFYGPFMMYHSTDWDTYLDGDYYALATSGMAAPSQTLRQRIRAIDGIMDVRRLDFLFGSTQTIVTDQTSNSYKGPGMENLVTGSGTPSTTGQWPFTFIFVQMTPDVARAVNGMDITTVQWESKGGMQLNFKVLCIQVPQVRADFYGNSGILQATTA
jgi:hypothetical protein